MAQPVAQDLDLIKSPEQVTAGAMVFDVSSASISRYQTFVVVSGKSGFTLSRSTDGKNFSEIATSTNAYYFDQNLAGSQTYYYKVAGVNGMISVRPGGVDTTASVVSNIQTKELAVTKNNTEVLISWQTDKLSTSELTINNQTIKDDSQNQSHAMVVSNLKPSQTYRFKIKSTNAENISGETSDQTLTISVVPAQETVWQLILQTLQNNFGKFGNWIKT
jgi:hypothetical protein